MRKQHWYSTFRLPFLPSSTEVDFACIFALLIIREDFLASVFVFWHLNVMYGSNSFQPKGKGKINSRAGHESLEEEERRVSTLLTSALDGWWVVGATPRPLYPPEKPGVHCIGGWLGPRAGLDVCGISRPPHRDSISVPSSP